MSKESLEQFMSKVADSEELQAKIGEEIDAEALIALGAECGCEFTAEELQYSAALSCHILGSTRFLSEFKFGYTISIREVRTIGTGVSHLVPFIRRKLDHKRGVRRAGGGGAQRSAGANRIQRLIRNAHKRVRPR